MKKITIKKKTLIAFCVFGFSISGLFSQTWQDHSIVSQNWPNNDVKSYGGNLYVASNDGLFRSSDNGNTWTDLTFGFSGYSDLVEIQFTNTGNIFARKNSFGVVRSLDGGSTWEYDTTGVGQNYETKSLYYDAVSDKVFLGIGWPKHKLYYQAPSDVAWTEVTNLPNGLNNFIPTQMTRKGSNLFVTDAYKRVLESSDNGITWVQKNGTGLGNADSQVGPTRFLAIGNDLYLGCGNIWKSTDDGDSWLAVDQGFPLQSGIYVDTRCLYYDGTKLYASTYTDRMTFESTDNGATWTDFGGTGSWFFKAMTIHNGSLYGVIHSKDSLYIYGNGTNSLGSSNSEISISIYPNPAQDFVTINDVPSGSTINMLDVTGKIVYSSVILNGQTTINTVDIEKGVYIIQAENKGAVTNQKLVVNR
jgi:photosystem II stability/assembly factor-like uncharacterized protein